MATDNLHNRDGGPQGTLLRVLLSKERSVQSLVRQHASTLQSLGEENASYDIYIQRNKNPPCHCILMP